MHQPPRDILLPPTDGNKNINEPVVLAVTGYHSEEELYTYINAARNIKGSSRVMTPPVDQVMERSK